MNSFEKIINFRIKSISYKTPSEINTKDLNEIKKIKQDLNTSYEEALNSLETYKNACLSLNRTEDVAKIEENIQELKQYNDLNLQYLNEISNENNSDKLKEIEKQHNEIGDKLFDYAYEAPKSSFNEFSIHQSALSERIQDKITLINILFILIFDISIFLAIRISKNISSPIKELQNAIYQVSKGNTNVKLPLNSKDEIGKLAQFFSTMINTLNNILLDIKTLSTEFEKGNISYRIDEGKYEGVFNDTIKSINITADSLIDDSLYIIEKVKEFGNGEFNNDIKQFIGEKSIITTELSSV
ncbi:HAMP domain-containing protein [[Clostridium] colinum]|uniref:HAMP domain-containing protein n=1 Tax=[Clostridium] colinum TaxID=36835 RepID=UPI0020241271|nr:HAMP domain-containing protein [[Clostridium] colinum]